MARQLLAGATGNGNGNGNGSNGAAKSGGDALDAAAEDATAASATPARRRSNRKPAGS
jgi:hypothetical protein